MAFWRNANLRQAVRSLAEHAATQTRTVRLLRGALSHHAGVLLQAVIREWYARQRSSSPPSANPPHLPTSLGRVPPLPLTTSFGDTWQVHCHPPRGDRAYGLPARLAPHPHAAMVGRGAGEPQATGHRLWLYVWMRDRDHACDAPHMAPRCDAADRQAASAGLRGDARVDVPHCVVCLHVEADGERHPPLTPPLSPGSHTARPRLQHGSNKMPALALRVCTLLTTGACALCGCCR